MPEDILTPISKVLLKENENLALILPKDIGRRPTFELYFFRVMRRYPINMSYDLLPELVVDEKRDFNFLGEQGFGAISPASKDMMRIWEERPFRILHFGYGIMPSGVRIYKAIPANTPQTGMAYELPTKVGDVYDWIDGTISPYDNPTVATETYLYHKLSFTLGLWNKTNRVVKPKMRFLGAGYDCIPITDKAFIEKILAGVKPCRFGTIGGLAIFTYVVPREWEGMGIVITKEEVERIAGGGRT
jgi:hypothetical protein